MTKFQNIQELRLERQKLYLKKEILEGEIEADFEELKASLKPLNMIKELFRPASENQNENEISPMSLNIGSTIIDMVMSKYLFNKSSVIKKFISSFFIRYVGPPIIQKVGPTIFSAARAIFTELVKKSSRTPNNDQSTVADPN